MVPIMPTPIDEHSGWQALLGMAATGIIAVVVKWLFATRRDLRTDNAESSAAHAYRETIEHQASRIQMLEGMLQRRDARIIELEQMHDCAKKRIERLEQLMDGGDS